MIQVPKMKQKDELMDARYVDRVFVESVLTKIPQMMMIKISKIMRQRPFILQIFVQWQGTMLLLIYIMRFDIIILKLDNSERFSNNQDYMRIFDIQQLKGIGTHLQMHCELTQILIYDFVMIFKQSLSCFSITQIQIQKQKLHRSQKSFLAMLIAFALLLTIATSQPTTSDNCKTYNHVNRVCTECIQGYYLQIYFCIPCNPRCACTSKNDYCQSCIDVSYKQYSIKSILHQSDNQCYLCSATIPFCIQCTSLSYCTKCYDGRYVIQVTDLDGTVTGAQCSSSTQICAQNCIICNSSTTCQTCDVGYFLFSNKTCSAQVCSQNCAVCQSQTVCNNCTDQFYLEQVSGVATCEPCMSNCLICDSSTTCTECFPSFNFQSGACVNNGNSNCVYYTGGFSTCMYCQPGYSIFAGSCNNCFGCQLCSAQFICTAPCQSGYSPFNYACLTSSQNMCLLVSLWVMILFVFF